MFLPHNLASSVRRSKRSKMLNGQRTLSEGASSMSGIMAPIPSTSGGANPPAPAPTVSSKKRGKTSGGPPPPADHERSPSLVARSWARLSRRGKRRKRDSSTAILSGAPRRDMIEGQPSGHVDSPQNPCTSASVEVAAECTASTSTDKKNIVVRGMDKLRRSFRKSFRRSKGQPLTGSAAGALAAAAAPSPPSASAGTVETTACSVHNGKTYCQPDEAAVRSAACSFQVKYLGAVEVFESRGMHICESALQQLRMKKRQTKAILYVTGDGIRVVDQESNRGLILDQTIEKVSFCAPDRHNDRGFAYICRDGATKRWMCHGFQSTKESGERLSHAVGCAFTICLEKKRKRDAETAAYRNGQAMALITNPSTSNFDKAFESAAARTSQASLRRAVPPPSNESGATFRRQLSIAERKLDPQTAIVVPNGHRPTSADPPATVDMADGSSSTANTAAALASTQTADGFAMATSAAPDLHSVAKPRPAANPSLFERQGSFKAPLHPANTSNFKRFNSLRSDLIGTASRLPSVKTLHSDPIYEGDDENLSAELCSLNFVGGGVSPPTNSFGTTQMSTSQSFAGQPSQPLGFESSFIRNDPKRASRADEWLMQILQTSAANGGHATNAQPTVYYNLATQMTPSNSTTSGGDFDAMAARLPYSQSFDGGFGTARFGPPPSQPPPPLPPSVTSRLNGPVPPRITVADMPNAMPTYSTQTSSVNSIANPTVMSADTTNRLSTATTATTSESSFTAKSTDTVVGWSAYCTKDSAFGFVQDIIKSPFNNGYGNQVGQSSGLDSTVSRQPTVKLPSTPRSSAAGSAAAARKSSAARLSIEYQLLEETDAPPQSPPRVDSPLTVVRPDSTGQCALNGYGMRNCKNGDGSATVRKPAAVSERCALTVSPTGAASAEAAIQAIRLATRSTLASAESAISALHSSAHSDDPFDVKWSAEVLQQTAAAALRKPSVEPLAANNC